MDLRPKRSEGGGLFPYIEIIRIVNLVVDIQSVLMLLVYRKAPLLEGERRGKKHQHCHFKYLKDERRRRRRKIQKQRNIFFQTLTSPLIIHRSLSHLLLPATTTEILKKYKSFKNPLIHVILHHDFKSHPAYY